MPKSRKLFRQSVTFPFPNTFIFYVSSFPVVHFIRNGNGTWPRTRPGLDPYQTPITTTFKFKAKYSNLNITPKRW